MKSSASVARLLSVLCFVVLAGLFIKQKNDLRKITADLEQAKMQTVKLDRALAVAQGKTPPEGGAASGLTSGASVAGPGAGSTAGGGIGSAAQAARPGRGQAPSELAADQPLTAGSASSTTPAHADHPIMLSMAGVDIKKADQGLVANMQFTPSQPGPIADLAMSVRLPRNTKARILDLEIAGSATDLTKEVSDDGKFAFIHGSVENVTNVQFALSVSEAGTAYVKGSSGIQPFEVTIKSE